MILLAYGCSTTINKRPTKSQIDCRRMVFTDAISFPLQTNHTHKYGEIVHFLKPGGKGFVLCIGINPKGIEKKAFDRSNQKIANYLISQGYDGYYLINPYSIITSNITELEKYIQNNPQDQRNDISEIVRYIINITTCPILVFSGETQYPITRIDINNCLVCEKGKGRKVIFSIDNNGNHIHVGSQKCGSRRKGKFK